MSRFRDIAKCSFAGCALLVVLGCMSDPRHTSNQPAESKIEEAKAEVSVPSANLPEANNPGDLADWFSLLARRRAMNLKLLSNYVMLNRFPKNWDYPGNPTPYFVDRDGAGCAIAALMITDHQKPVVDWIAQFNNNVKVMDIKEDRTGGRFPIE